MSRDLNRVLLDVDRRLGAFETPEEAERKMREKYGHLLTPDDARPLVYPATHRPEDRPFFPGVRRQEDPHMRALIQKKDGVPNAARSWHILNLAEFDRFAECVGYGPHDNYPYMFRVHYGKYYVENSKKVLVEGFNVNIPKHEFLRAGRAREIGFELEYDTLLGTVDKVVRFLDMLFHKR